MRLSWLALLGAALVTPALLAQPPVVTPAPAPDRLDEVLLKWEQSMSRVSSLAAQCVRTKVDKTYQTTEVFEGVAKYLRVDKTNYASLEMYKRGRRDIFEKWICGADAVYEFAPQNKEVRVHELPKPPPGQVSDDNFVSFLFGMKAGEAKRRYQLTWVPPPANDRWYYYVDIRPRSKDDAREFTHARLVLLASTFMPRQLWFEEPNGNEITWDFPAVQPGAALTPAAFSRPAVPAGWQIIQAPRPPQAPRIIRQQQ
jgi:TIGR03009 family protein